MKVSSGFMNLTLMISISYIEFLFKLAFVNLQNIFEGPINNKQKTLELYKKYCYVMSYVEKEIHIFNLLKISNTIILTMN